MLVLTRRPDEGIIITTPSGEEIQVKLVSARQGNAKIGIEAATDCVILREELVINCNPFLK